MPTQIILLRGVMPTGRNKVPMAPLREALGKAGLHNVRTLIQSGNVIADTRLGQARLEALVHDTIAETFGGDIAVFARPAQYFRRALQCNPFRGEDPTRTYLTLLSAAPEPALLKGFLAPGYAPDRIEFIDDQAWLLVAAQISDSKLNNNLIERKLKLRATTRIHNTIVRLVEMAA